MVLYTVPCLLIDRKVDVRCVLLNFCMLSTNKQFVLCIGIVVCLIDLDQFCTFVIDGI